MRKVMVVTVREYLAAVKSKAFVITIVLMPVLMGFGLVAGEFLEGEVDLGDKRMAVIDRTGQLYDALAAVADDRNANEIFELESDPETGQPKQILPRYVLERVTHHDTNHDQLLFDLSARVRDGELFAFVEIGSDVLSTEAGDEPASVNYFSNTPTYRDLRRWLSRSLTAEAQKLRFAQSGLDIEMVTWALQPTQLEHLGLLTRNEVTGEIVQADKIDDVASFLVPAMMVMFLFMVIMTGASPLIQGVMEEKTLRIAEVLLSSLTPFQWMMGKLCGCVGVSMTIVVIYLTGGAIVADRYEVLSYIPFDLLGWFAAYQILAVLMFGAVFIAVGAACTDHREAQSLIMPVMIMIILPMMMWPTVIREPNTVFAVLISLFPPATPMLMLIRQSIPPAIPLWQPILGMVLVVLTTVACIFVAGRIFRVGMLVQGKGANYRELIRWVIKG